MTACCVSRGGDFRPVSGPDDAFYSDFSTITGNSVFISRGGVRGKIALKTDGERLFVVVDGEPRGEYLLKSFREGLDRGLIRPNMRTLVDMRGFKGGANWGAVFTLRTYAPWGRGKEGVSCCAYIVRNDMFGALIKIAETLFGLASHRSFHDPAEAIAWLKTKAADAS